MRALLDIVLAPLGIALVLLASVAVAQLCPDTPDGYARQSRPAGQPANYPPAGEPACFMRVTVSENTVVSCYLCHAALQKRFV